MKTKTQKIISLIVAVTASIIVYINMTVAKSLCYYAGNSQKNFIEIRDTCYEKYSVGMFLAEVSLVFLIVYFVTFYVLKIFRDGKIKNKNIR